jgi:hypothetical protein
MLLLTFLMLFHGVPAVCSGYFAFNALRSTPLVTRYTTVAVITAGVPGVAGNLAVVVVLAVLKHLLAPLERKTRDVFAV